MTQSGRGEEPSAQPAREGIVLPSDGGEPLLPGVTAAPAPVAPVGGQAWGGSWAPEQQAPQQGQDWPSAPAEQWAAPGAPEPQVPPAAHPGPLPPEGAQAPSYGGQAASYGVGGQDPHYGGQGGVYGAPDPHQQHYQAPPAPLPPAVPDGYPAAGAPLPPAAEGATQYLPPVPAASPEGATQYLPPVPAAPADEGATQYLPPMAPGALPPEPAGEATPYPGHAPESAAPVSPDAEATQYIPPYAAQGQGGDRQPPTEFDNLFRNAPAGDGPAGSTQQFPRVPQPDAHESSYAPAQPSYAPPRDDDRAGRGGRSRVPLIAAVGVGIVVIGLGAGALLSGGGDSKDQGGDGKTVAATSAAPQNSGSPADPARQQAAALDRLLADSGSSRASVIKAVADVKQCSNLDQAAAGLRDAAQQRTGLVTRLGKLPMDKLPDNAALKDALTRAWQASAAADSHYAAWADQVKGGRKGCHKGHARVTGETQAGNRESGTASAQKTKAAALWNAIARKYGLTQRQPTQL